MTVGRTTSEQSELLATILTLLVADVALDHARGDLVAHGANEIPVRPQLATPQLVANLGELSEERFGGKALEGLDELGGGESGRSGDEQVDVVALDVLLDDVEAIGVGDLGEEGLEEGLDLGGAQVLTVLRGPDEVVVELVDTVGGPAVRHTRSAYHGVAKR